MGIAELYNEGLLKDLFLSRHSLSTQLKLIEANDRLWSNVWCHWVASISYYTVIVNLATPIVPLLDLLKYIFLLPETNEEPQPSEIRYYF